MILCVQDKRCFCIDVPQVSESAAPGKEARNGFLALAHICTEQLRALNSKEVQARFSCYRTRQQRFGTSWRSK